MSYTPKRQSLAQVKIKVIIIRSLWRNSSGITGFSKWHKSHHASRLFVTGPWLPNTVHNKGSFYIHYPRPPSLVACLFYCPDLTSTLSSNPKEPHTCNFSKTPSFYPWALAYARSPAPSLSCPLAGKPPPHHRPWVIWPLYYSGRFPRQSRCKIKDWALEDYESCPPAVAGGGNMGDGGGSVPYNPLLAIPKSKMIWEFKSFPHLSWQQTWPEITWGYF